MPPTARQVLDAHVAALNHGTLQDVLDTFATDAVFTSDGGTATGHDELASLFQSTTGTDSPTTIVRRFEQADETITCRLTRRFTVQDEKGRVAAAHDVEVSALFVISGGLIAEVRVDPIE